MNGISDEQISDGQVFGWIDEWTGRWMLACINKSVSGCMYSKMDGQRNELICNWIGKCMGK